jgi:hypothetical protein
VGTGVGDGVRVGVGAAVGELVGTVVARGVGDGVGVTLVDPQPASRAHMRRAATDRATPCRAIAPRIASVRSDGPPRAFP